MDASRLTLNPILLCVVALPLLFFACTSDKIVQKPETKPLSITNAKASAIAPLKISELKTDIDKCNEIKHLIDERNARFESWGLMIVSVNDGRVTCSKDSEKLFSPASVQKLVTTAVALDKFGLDHKIRTSVYSQNKPVNGVIAGDLILYGRGAPDFDKSALSKIVARLKSDGIEKIDGDVIGDESYFRADGLGDGWTWNSAQWYYGAAASALSYERNLVTIIIKNGRPSVDSSLVELSGDLEPIESIEAIGIKRRLGTNEVFVWGNGSNLKARIAVARPAAFAARIFKETLEKNGIKVTGKSDSADWKQPAYSTSLHELVSAESAPLSELISTMNRDSVNLYAELLIRLLGRKYGIEAPDEEPKMNLLRGVDAAGSAYVEKWLSDNGLATDGIAIHDGSGLSRLDRISPESISRLLLLAAKEKYSKAFLDSLPAAGQTGTLRGRLKTLQGKLSAKTGSIQYANSLAGFAESGDETFAFTIFCNDETTRSDSSVTIDKIAELIVGIDD